MPATTLGNVAHRGAAWQRPMPPPPRHSRAIPQQTVHRPQRSMNRLQDETSHSSRSTVCFAAYAARSDSQYRHPGEMELNLQEYMVVLEKPVGLTLAPDPHTGKIVVQDIKADSPADRCGLIQVGDMVKSCSAVFGDDMWAAGDIRRVRWAINNRMGDVRLVLERAEPVEGAAVGARWYCRGKTGIATRERDGMQLPCAFIGPPTPEETQGTLDLPGAGRVLQMTFHRSGTGASPPPTRRAAAAVAARMAALARWRRELAEARAMPRLDLSNTSTRTMHGPDGFGLPPAGPPGVGRVGSGTSSRPGSSVSSSSNGTAASGMSSSNSGSNSGSMSNSNKDTSGPPHPPMTDPVAPAPPPSSESSGGSGGGSYGGGPGGLFAGLRGMGGAAVAAAAAGERSGAGGGGKEEHKIITFLPWLLVSCGRLEPRHIAHIASSRSLGALLELSLTRAGVAAGAAAAGEAAGAGVAGAGVEGAAGAAAAGAGSSSSSSSSSNGTGPGAPGSNGNKLGAVNGAEGIGAADGSSSSSNGSSSNGNGVGAARTGGGGGSGTGAGGKAGGYLVVRGADLQPLVSDIGRVSYQALLATANGSGTASNPTPVGEAPPPPPPGSAAATAALINGTSAVDAAASGSLLATLGTGGMLPAGGAATVPQVAGTAGSPAAAAPKSPADGGAAAAASNAMAFLGRSIFINLSPSFGNGMGSIFGPGTAGAIGGASSASGGTPSAAAASPPASGVYDPERVRHLLNAAASLHRLWFRRGGRLHRARREACAVLLRCDGGMEAEVAVLLAGWLHWFARLPLQEAMLAAETAMGVAVDQALLEAGTAVLLAGARERCSRVVLTWKYGGLSAYVAGDVVASWAARVPMVRCRSPLGCKGDTAHGHFFLEVQGLRPGVYYYKYIVDGTWAVDSLSPKVLDSAGNWNNVLVVQEPPQVLTSREGLALARWQAARLALEAKMGLQGPGALQRPR